MDVALLCAQPVTNSPLAHNSSNQEFAALTPEKIEARLVVQWAKARPILHQRLVKGLERGDTNALYTTQLKTANLLIWAHQQTNVEILNELAELYLQAFPFAKSRNQMNFYYASENGRKRITTAKVAPPMRAWIPKSSDGEHLPESVLDSAQFLYALVRLARAQLTNGMNADFAVPAQELALSHIYRWVSTSDTLPGSFQRRGWGCSKGSYSHAEHVANLKNRAYGSDLLPRARIKKAPRYCNAVLDSDLFISAIVGELLLIEEMPSWSNKMDQEIKTLLEKHLSESLKLISSRMSKTILKTSGYGDKVGLLFDKGVWDDYPDYRWSNYTGSAYPGWSNERNKKNNISESPAAGVGWDISHARRFVQFLDTLDALIVAKINTHFANNDLSRVALQIIGATWNGSTSEPKFANYVDGTNGWYRVNYSQRPGYGIEPFGFDDDIIASGYGNWSSFDPLIRTALLARANQDQIVQKPPEYQIQWLASASLLFAESR